MIGTTLGHYRVVEKIGEGGMGEVYRAYDERLDRDVAIKVLPEEVANRPDRMARFEREAKALAALNHPNIATIHGFETASAQAVIPSEPCESRDPFDSQGSLRTSLGGGSGQQPSGSHPPDSSAAASQGDASARNDSHGVTFLVMELLEGETLRERLENGALGWRKTVETGAAIAEGLAAAHGAGIIHRDLKPDNVFITNDGRVKILDFGLARDVAAASPDETQSPTVSRYTDPGAVMGTAPYMSPEQVRGEPADQRSDIFSLGSILYEMVTGRRAFVRDTAAETMTAILREEPAEVSGTEAVFPPEFEQTIRRCLEKRPEARFQSASDLGYNLKTISSASLQTVSQTEPKVRGRKRRTLAFVAVAAAAVAVTLYFGRGSDEPVGIGASGRPAVAVMPFDCTAASEDVRWLRQGVPDMLVTGLAQTQGLDVVSSERLLEILDRLIPESAETIAPGRVLEVARRAGAGAVVVGSVMGAPPELRIDVRIQDPTDGRLLFAHDMRGDEVFVLVDKITEQIRVDLGLASDTPSRGMAELTSESLEAYRLYAEGRNAARNHRASDARELFRQAVEIDPSFTMAYFELSFITPDAALREEYKSKTIDGLDRLSERERLTVESYAASWAGDDEKAVRLQEELVLRYPDEPEAYIRLSGLYGRSLGDQERRIQTLERGVAAVPTDGPLRNVYAYHLLNTGRFDEGVRQLKAYVRLAPNEPNPHDSLGDAYLMMGHPEEAISRYTAAIALDDAFDGARLGRAWARAVLGRYDLALADIVEAEDFSAGSELIVLNILEFKAQLLIRVGRYREAEQVVGEYSRLAREADATPEENAAHLLSAIIDLDRGHLSTAVDKSSRVIEALGADGGGNLLAHCLAGVAAARSGRLTLAKDHEKAAATISNRQSWSETWVNHSLEGEIALAAGELDRAETAFAAGLSFEKMPIGTRTGTLFLMHNSPFRDWRARISMAQGDAVAAIADYRRLLTPSAEQKFVGVLEPRFVLELARLLDQEGDHEAAHQEYQRFLNLWKNADPNLPELAEARTRLAQLETTPP